MVLACVVYSLLGNHQLVVSSCKIYTYYMSISYSFLPSSLGMFTSVSGYFIKSELMTFCDWLLFVGISIQIVACICFSLRLNNIPFITCRPVGFFFFFYLLAFINTSYKFFNVSFSVSQVWWYRPVIVATLEAKTGGL